MFQDPKIKKRPSEQRNLPKKWANTGKVVLFRDYSNALPEFIRQGVEVA